MPNMLPKSNEVILESLKFTESISQYGSSANLWLVKSETKGEFGIQPNIEYESEPIVINVFIDPHPQIKLLRKLGWYAEDSGNVPMICYIGRYYLPEDSKNITDYVKRIESAKELVPTKYVKLDIEYDYYRDKKEFVITEVNQNSFNNVYYICKIVPYREKELENVPDTNDPNLEFITKDTIDPNFKFFSGGNTDGY